MIPATQLHWLVLRHFRDHADPADLGSIEPDVLRRAYWTIDPLCVSPCLERTSFQTATFIYFRLDELEKRLAAGPVITVPTITLEGDANGAPHPEPNTYAGKFADEAASSAISRAFGRSTATAR